MAIVLKYATKTDLAARLRQYLKLATKEEACRLAHKLQLLIDGGDVTDAQLRNLFNVTQSELNVIKARIAAKAALWVDVQAAGAE